MNDRPASPPARVASRNHRFPLPLRGTGDDEYDLLPLRERLAPMAAALSVRWRMACPGSFGGCPKGCSTKTSRGPASSTVRRVVRMAAASQSWGLATPPLPRTAGCGHPCRGRDTDRRTGPAKIQPVRSVTRLVTEFLANSRPTCAEFRAAAGQDRGLNTSSRCATVPAMRVRAGRRYLRGSTSRSSAANVSRTAAV
jgi:hypothetical protein